MKNKKYIFLFISAIAVSLVVFGCTYNILSGKSVQNNFSYQLLLNLPLCIAIGFMDLGIIHFIGRKIVIKSGSVRIMADLTITTLLCALIAAMLNYLLSNECTSAAAVLKTAIPIIPWNWIIVLQIEIFLYNSRQTQIEKEKALYQFEVLKNQVNPHFLFNSLNVLASLAYQDAEKTNRFCKKLSSVYRYLLTTHEQQTVTLGEELAFLESYLYLETIRFGNTLHVEIDDAHGKENRPVIPASIQMLVENAIKHNINTSESPLAIHIRINETGIMVSNNLQLRNYAIKNGTGLNNLKKQYALYGKEVSVMRNTTDFAVKIPFIE